MEGECGRVSLEGSEATMGYKCLPLERGFGSGGGSEQESFAFHFRSFLSCACSALIKRNPKILEQIRSENNSSTAVDVTINND